MIINSKRIVLSIAASTLLATTLTAATQNISVDSGWNLVGSSLDGVSTSSLSDVQSVWTYDTSGKKWNVTSPDGSLTSKIDALGTTVGTLTTINAGDGFWVNNATSLSLNLTGTETATTKTLESGWNLISFQVDGTKSIENMFTSTQEGNIYTVWAFNNGMWKAWSPGAYAQNLIKSSTSIGLLTEITAGTGYWVNTTSTLDITPPDATLPDFVIVNEVIGDGGNIAPLGNVNIYNSETGVFYGTTELNGKFDLSLLNLPDNTPLKAMKDGYTTTIGNIENGFINFVLMPLNSKSTAVDMVANGDQKPLKNYGFISSDYATVEVSPSTASESLTFTVTAYKNPESLPKIVDSIILDGNSTTPMEISVIGAANINLKGSDGKTKVLPSDFNGKLDFNYKLEKFIGDLESILNGLTGSANDSLTKFNPKALELLESAQEKGLMNFYLIQQQEDGSWLELDKATPVVEGEKIKLKKATDGKITTFGSGNIAYIIKTEAVQGFTEICFEQKGYRMNDGSVVTSNENNSSTYDFVGKPVKDLIIIGDQNVIGQPTPSAETGCTTINYKVPYLSPMYQITAVSEGNFDKSITMDIEFGDLLAPFDPDNNASTTDNNVPIYKIPERATIEGYIKSTLDGADEQGVGKAIVTLQDPQILTKDKVIVDNTNGKKTITLEANPNVTFTYTLVREDDNTTKEVIKSGKIADDETANILTQVEVEDIIYGTDSSTNPWLEDPYGNYFIAIEAVHEYAEDTNITFNEQILVSFTAKVDEKALINAFSYSVNQGDAPTYKLDANGTNPVEATDEEKASLSTISIFGGKDISLFKALSTGTYAVQASDWEWDSYILSMGSSLGTDLNTSNDPNPYLKVILEANAQEANGNAPEVVKQLAHEKFTDEITFGSKTYKTHNMPFANVYKMFNEKFPLMVSTDFNLAQSDIDDALTYEDLNITKDVNSSIPLYQAGFTVFNTYNAEFIDNSTLYKTYAGSYTNLDWFKLNSVDDFSDILDFKVSANEPTAYSARYTTTENDGFYQINQIAPSIIPTLELTARAEGHEYGVENERPAGAPHYKNGTSFDELDDINDTTGLTTAIAGDVLTHNFMLKRIAPPAVEVNTTIPDVVPELPSVNQDFENGLVGVDGNWSIVALDTSAYYNNPSENAVWNVVNNASLPTVNSSWATTYGYDDNTTILPTPYGDNYAWMGDTTKGTYQSSDYKAVATALKSPVIDFSNYSLAVLNFKQWFEVSAYDASFDTAFVGFEIQEDGTKTNGTTIKLQDAGGYTTYVTVGQTYIKRVTPETPVINGYEYATYLSNKGLNTEPMWSDFKLPLDVLAGQKAKIVFGFFSKDTLFNDNRGWGIDNVFIQDNLENAITLPPMVPSLDNNISTDAGIVETNTTVVPTV